MGKLHRGHMAALLKDEDGVPPCKPGTMLMASQAPTMQNAISPAAAPSLSYRQGHAYYFVQTQGPVAVNCPALSDQCQVVIYPLCETLDKRFQHDTTQSHSLTDG